MFQWSNRHTELFFKIDYLSGFLNTHKLFHFFPAGSSSSVSFVQCIVGERSPSKAHSNIEYIPHAYSRLSVDFLLINLRLSQCELFNTIKLKSSIIKTCSELVCSEDVEQCDAQGNYPEVIVLWF